MRYPYHCTNCGAGFTDWRAFKAHSHEPAATQQQDDEPTSAPLDLGAILSTFGGDNAASPAPDQPYSGGGGDSGGSGASSDWGGSDSGGSDSGSSSDA